MQFDYFEKVTSRVFQQICWYLVFAHLLSTTMSEGATAAISDLK
jgi:hypothetical protein